MEIWKIYDINLMNNNECIIYILPTLLTNNNTRY